MNVIGREGHGGTNSTKEEVALETLHLASNACVYTNLTNREISVTGNLPLLVGAKLPKPLIDRTVPVRLRPAMQCYFSC